MSGYNKAVIVGRLTRDPDVKYSANGNIVVNVSVATSEKYSGEEHTEFHRIVMFGKVGEVAAEFLKKGSQALFDGKIQTRSYEKDGVTKYSTEILAFKMEMMGSRTEQPKDHVDGNSVAGPVSKAPDDLDSIPF